MEKSRFVAGGENVISNHFCGDNPKYLVTKSNHLELALRSDADPDGTAIKNFILRVEKTKGMFQTFERKKNVTIIC